MWCDMQGPDGGWILLQERANATFNTFRNWSSYENGFGKPGVGYWLGNIHIHSITFKRKYALRLEFPGYADILAEYENFQVLGPSSGYVLKLGKYQRGLEDILSDVNNSAFATWDHDIDGKSRICAKKRKGAWWYGKKCYGYDMNSMHGFIHMKIKTKELLEGNIAYCKNFFHKRSALQTPRRLRTI